MTFGAPARGEKKETNSYSCQAVVRRDSRRSHMCLPFPPSSFKFRLVWHLTDDTDEASCTPNRGSPRSDVRVNVTDSGHPAYVPNKRPKVCLRKKWLVTKIQSGTRSA